MTKTGSTEAPNQSDYCVQGNTLKLRQTSQTDSGTGVTSSSSSMLVLTRQ